MKKIKYKPSIEESRILSQILEQFSFEALEVLRSGLHSATIRKGYSHPALVLESITQTEGIVKKGLEVHIPFKNVKLSDGYSQKGYTVDIYVETNDVIYLVDPKGVAHNNNTPISDEIQKWVFAKEEVRLLNPTKEVRFILLKPDDVNEYEFQRLKKLYNDYGIELHKTDNFLSDFTNQETSISQILRDHKDKLMREHIMNIISN
jgi:hypothetical protein